MRSRGCLTSLNAYALTLRGAPSAWRPYPITQPLSMSVTPKSGLVESPVPIEEETVRGYKAKDYYPVRIGQVFQGQYKTIGKLGYGSASTVWLCRDLMTQDNFVTLKVYINSSKEHRELSICRHISSVSSEHPGREHVRKLLNSFEIEGPHGKHICLVCEPLGNSLGELSLLADGALESHIIRQTMRPILTALQFLHTEARIIHTGGREGTVSDEDNADIRQDLQPNNILLGIHDSSILAEFEGEEMQKPSPRKELHDRTIYVSRPMPLARGWPSLSDFSEARFGGVKHTDLVMPDMYRAPEVILGMPWSYPIDIWAFAMVIWDLFEPERLFTAADENGRYSEAHHLAQMVSVLGPPPQDFLRRSSRCEKYWDQNGIMTAKARPILALTNDITGNWIGNVAIPDRSLHKMEKRLASEVKTDFLEFMRKMLKWKPEDRSDCNDIFFSEWLVADLIESGQIVRDSG
nr:serine/threonine-protein kinase srpk [Quercus suber]